MTQQQDQRPYPGQVNQFGNPVAHAAPTVTPHPSSSPSPGRVPTGAPDTVAVLAVICALPAAALGLGLGIWAMFRTRRPGVGGRGLAVAAVSLSSVVLVGGLLAAIAIPVFLNQRNKAVEADLAQDLRTAATVLHGERALQGAFPVALPQPVATSGRTDQVVLVWSSADAFCLAASGDERVLYLDEQSLTSTRGCP